MKTSWEHTSSRLTMSTLLYVPGRGSPLLPHSSNSLDHGCAMFSSGRSMAGYPPRVNGPLTYRQGVFYPYHRLMMHLYEQELHTCGWEGGIPYWDWVLDVDDFFNSPLFDTESGFGGNGDWVPGNFTYPEPGFSVNTPWDVVDRTGGGCIQDGSFRELQTHMGPADSTEYNPQCVRRDFAPDNFANMSGPATVEQGMSRVNHGWFDNVTESTFHAGGHWGVGGLYGHMTDKWVSRKFHPHNLHTKPDRLLTQN